MAGNIADTAEVEWNRETLIDETIMRKAKTERCVMNAIITITNSARTSSGFATSLI